MSTTEQAHRATPMKLQQHAMLTLHLVYGEITSTVHACYTA